MQLAPLVASILRRSSALSTAISFVCHLGQKMEPFACGASSVYVSSYQMVYILVVFHNRMSNFAFTVSFFICLGNRAHTSDHISM
jgi:hypothetical protein